MENVKWEVKDNKLIIEVDLSLWNSGITNWDIPFDNAPVPVYPAEK